MAFTALSVAQTDADSPINETLMSLIRTNLNDLDARGYVDNYTAGTNYLLKSANTERQTTTSNTMTKKKEIIVVRNGSINTSFEARYGGGGGWTAARIYINGTPVGTDHSVTNTTYATYTDSGIAVSNGDLVQLYARGDGGSLYTAVRNFKLMSNVPSSETVVLD